MVAADDPEDFCRSCRLNDVIPNLADDRRLKLWYEVEKAKRRLMFTLMRLGLSVKSKRDSKNGLAFRILADARLEMDRATSPVLDAIPTGYAGGFITLNLLEADPAMREEMRKAVNESYRTVLGHCRHESGHYYFWRLVVDSRRDEFRRLFGDERVNYEQRLAQYYNAGPPVNWNSTFITPYAASHPLEDFAETWAHYLHIVDTLETAQDEAVEIHGQALQVPLWTHAGAFEEVLIEWQILTRILNLLVRSLGVPDVYPFDIMPGVAEKLKFVHETIHHSRQGR